MEKERSSSFWKTVGSALTIETTLVGMAGASVLEASLDKDFENVDFAPSVELASLNFEWCCNHISRLQQLAI